MFFFFSEKMKASRNSKNFIVSLNCVDVPTLTRDTDFDGAGRTSVVHQRRAVIQGQTKSASKLNHGACVFVQTRIRTGLWAEAMEVRISCNI